MSAIASRSSYRVADEQEWLESSVNVDPSPASVWAPDYEEEDETTLQGTRVNAQPTELMSPNIEKEELVVEPPRQVRMLDESQVLAGEASFATVRLNQPLEESVLKPQPSCDPLSTSSIEDDRKRESASRVQLLDEAKILAGEASFATVMLGERAKAQRHSPITEFLVKTKLSLKQLVLAMFALLSVLALGVFVLLITMSSGVVPVSSAPPPTTPDTTSQSASTSTTESSESLLNSAKVSGPAGPTQALATIAEPPVVAEVKLIERPSSDDSRKAPAKDVRSGAVSQETVRESKEVIETKKQSASATRKAVKEPAAVKTPNASVRSEARETRSEPATRQSEVPITVENVETKTPPITGGGERPRTVTRKPSP